MINQWRQLLANLQVIENDFGVEILSEDKLTAFEIQNNITLPADYKYFCQIFGSASLGNLVVIFCPSNYLLEAQNMIGGMINQIRRDPSPNLNRNLEYINLLSSAFMIGEYGAGGSLIFWDLTTYSESDKSYDIYWADWETPECSEPVFIGRSFFEFVRDFCYGTKPFDLIPELMEGLSPEDIEYTFSRFNPSLNRLDWDAICSIEERSPDYWRGDHPD